MDNRYDFQPELVRYLAQPFRCSNQLSRSCNQILIARTIVPQPLDLRGVDLASCPYPATRQKSNGVEVITYPPDAAYAEQWRCRVAKWYQR